MQAFEGIRVLDLTHVLAGPFSTYQLAVLGADVIKIEPVDDMDMNRQIGPVSELNAVRMGTHFQSQASNKRAMTLNLKSEPGKEIFMKLACESDVIVENFRAGALEAIGLGYDSIRAVNPGIVYCSLTGFGQTGPKRSHGAFDNVIQAYSGFLNTTGSEDGQAYQVGAPALDYGTGAQAAFAIASALFRRERTGEGQRIDIAMLDAAIMFMTSSVLNYSMTGSVPMPSGNRSGSYAGYGCYDAADTLLALGVVTARQHVRMWKALGRDDLAEQAQGLAARSTGEQRSPSLRRCHRTHSSVFRGAAEERAKAVKDIYIAIEAAHAQSGADARKAAAAARAASAPLAVGTGAALIATGADVATIPPSILSKLIHHPLTDKGLEQFLADWEATGQSIL